MLPNQRWRIHEENPALAEEFATNLGISPIISQLLINRGINNLLEAQIFLNPEVLNLASPLQEFPDLQISLDLLQASILNQERIAICGDYDADGMTSTALLLRCLRWLGANVDYAIPSRMKDGYGINKRIVEELYDEEVKLILTVDNGIAAADPIARARELGIKVIITDHHEIPQVLPNANAILNPKLISESSPYYTVAGVGVAYLLAVSLAQQMGQLKNGMVKPLLELFTLGTIADLAPLTGVNRRWVKRGLKQLPKSQIPGIQQLILVSGVQAKGEGLKQIVSPNPSVTSSSITPSSKTLKPDDIGFRLGPRINAIGRIGDPQIVITLLTTDDEGVALEMAMQCEIINRSRQEMCEEIEKQAVALVDNLYAASLKEDRVLVVVQPNWHHGVIGIVASRLVERFGVPVFIGTTEEDGHIRGSARGIPEFHVFEALEYCDGLLGKYGGHKAAGGFSLAAENLPEFRTLLSEFANQSLEVQHLKPLIKIDALVNFNQISDRLYQELSILQPCGIDNPNPIFWTSNVQVLGQQTVGKGHIKAIFSQVVNNQQYQIKGIAWRWRDYFPLPRQVDIAYKLRENHFNDKTTIELEVVGVRLPTESHWQIPSVTKPITKNLTYKNREYSCGVYPKDNTSELRIKNTEGKVLAIKQGEKIGFLGTNRENAEEVNISQPQYEMLIQEALRVLRE
jgi:single-stranded-DNA-specific exonuclease